MKTIESEIDNLFGRLKRLVNQVSRLRREVETREKELDYVQREYDRVVGPFNEESDRLDSLKMFLRMRLAPSRDDTPSPDQPPNEVEAPRAPPETLFDDGPGSPAPTLPPHPEDPRTKRKRTLADHIDLFVASEERETVMEVINAILGDDRRDTGDMLEVLSWGDIWTARPAWETPEQQLERLRDWESVVNERLAYWKTRSKELNKDLRHGLLKEMKSRKPTEWKVYLDQLARKQEDYNKKISREIDLLEKESAKQSKGEESNGKNQVHR